MRFLGIMINLVFWATIAMGQRVPEKLPDYTFFTQSNKPFQIASLSSGKSCLIVFLDASCQHCQKAASVLNSNVKALAHIGVYLIISNLEGTASDFMNAYAPDLKLMKNVVLLNDPSQDSIKKFGITRYPAAMLFDESHRLIVYETSEDNFFRIWRKRN